MATTSATGLSRTTQWDRNGDGVVDATRTDVTVLNVDGSRTETVSDRNQDNSLKGRTVTTTSANGLSVTMQVDADGNGTFEQTRTGVTALNADGSRTETLSGRDGNQVLRNKVTTVTSADGNTVSIERDINGDGVVDQTATDVLSANGSRIRTVSDFNANATLSGRSVVTISASGLSTTTQQDTTGAGTFDQRRTDVTVINADGSRVETITELNANNALRDTTVITTSANGLSTTVQQDTTGDGNVDLTITDVTVLGANGSSTQTVTGTAADGSLKSKTVTAVSSDRKTATTQIDSHGVGHFDQVQTRVVNVDGSVTATVADYNTNGSLKDRTVTTTSASGLSVTTQIDANGDGVVDLTRTDVTVLNADGSRTETISDLNTNNSLRDKTVVTTSATGLSQTTRWDLNGDGVVDATRTDVTVLNVDGSRTETVTDLNHDSSLKARTVTTTSANGLSRTTQVDANGDGANDLTQTDVTVLNANGSRTATVSDLNGNQTLRNRVTTITSADGTASIERDVNGDGVVDQTATEVLNANGSRVRTVSDFTGAALKDRKVTTTSANGLSVTVERDIDGNGSIDQTRTDVTVLNPDGSLTETITNSSAGTMLDREVITTGANLNSRITQQDTTGAGVFNVKEAYVRVLNADGSVTETWTVTNADDLLKRKTIATRGSDERNTSLSYDIEGDGIVDHVVTVSNGGLVTTTSDYDDEGTLIHTSVTTTSADGLSVTTQRDTDGSGTFEQTRTDVTVLNANGSRTETISDFNANLALVGKAVITTSADGLSTTTQWDINGDSTLDSSRTDVTVLNADGSRTQTVQGFNGAGQLTSSRSQTTSANGLSEWTQWTSLSGGQPNQLLTDVTVLNADGSRTETITAALQSNTTITTSADGRTKTVASDTNGDGAVDQSQTTVSTTNADGSRTETVTNRNADGSVRDSTTTKTSADHRTTSVSRDADGNGTIDQTEVTVNAIDGSEVVAITDFGPQGAVTSRAIVTTSADGLFKSTQWDFGGDGIIDRVRSDLTVKNADGSSTQTIADTDTIDDGILRQISTMTVSADGRTKTLNRDSQGQGVFDHMEVTTVKADGSATTVAENFIALVALQTITTVSADGLTKTVKKDSQGLGFYDYLATTEKAIDGKAVTRAVFVNTLGQTIGRSVTTVSADGTLTTIQTDGNNDGGLDSVDSIVTRIDGSTVSTHSDFNADGTIINKTVTRVSANEHVTTTEQPPLNHVPGNQVIQANTSTAIPSMSITDPGGSGTLTAKLSAAHGVINVNPNAGAAVSGNGTKLVTLTGTVAQINAELATLTYTGSQDYFGSDRLWIATSGSKGGQSNFVDLNVGRLIVDSVNNNGVSASYGFNERIVAQGHNETLIVPFALVDASISWANGHVIINGPGGSHYVVRGFYNYAFTDGTVWRGSDQLVDNLYYNATYHDVWAAHADPSTHYHTTGWQQGRNPSAFFSTNWYLANNGVTTDPLSHYDAVGWHQGRNTGLFNTNLYLSIYPGVAAAGLNPLAHYLFHGMGEGRDIIAPSNATLSGGTVAENSPVGTVVGTVTGFDPDPNDTLAYSLIDAAGGRFAINSATGVITVANSSLISYVSATSYNITARTTDMAGLTFDKTFTIAVTDVNPPTNLTLAGSVAEKSANGTVVGTAAGTNPDSGDTLTYSLTNNAGGRFAVNSATGVITVANGTLLDYESATAHTVTVRTIDRVGLTFDKVFNIALTNVNEAPTNATLTGGSVAENSANGTAVGTVTGVDPDAGATFSYSLTNNAGGRFAINASTGAITVANGALLNYESATSHAITVRVTDQGGLTFDKALTIAVTNANEALSGATLSTSAVAENAANGSAVGTLTNVTPDPGATLTYGLVNDAGGRFAINATTGAITVANGTLLDHEAVTSHAITVRVTDQGGLTADKNFTIAVTNVNETPTNATLSASTVTENAVNGAAVGTVTGADPDAGTTFSYSLTNNAGGRFAVNASTGAITVANGALLDYESATSHAVTVRVTDQGGLTFDKAFTITLTDGNDALVGAILSTGVIAENAANGSAVGSLTNVTPGPGATLTYSLVDNAGGRFAINATTGAITVANGSLLDYEAATSHSITVRATDQGGLIGDKVFTVSLTNVNEAPTNATLSPNAVAESAANGTAVGTVAGIDPDAGTTFTYSLTDDAGGRFAINATTGAVTVANGALLDYEVATAHAIAVRVTDQGGLTVDKNFTIAVTNVNETPTGATLSASTVAENAANGTAIGTVTASDPDAGTTFTYALTDNAGGRFAINATTGAITVANGGLLNYEAATSHVVSVRVTDQGGLTLDKNFTIAVTNVNEAPNATTLVGGTIAENSVNGTAVGTVTSTDPDAGATLTYSLANSAGGRFAINATTGAITVANASLLDYDTANSHNITVRTTDQGGLTFDKVFTINLTNVNEAPTSATLSPSSVAENAANGTAVGTVAGVDPDAGATFSYALTNNAGGRFAINAATGAITVANGSLLNYEAAASHAITVRVTDQGGLTVDQNFTIGVTNVNEAPTNATLSAQHRGGECRERNRRRYRCGRRSRCRGDVQLRAHRQRGRTLRRSMRRRARSRWRTARC